MRKPSCPEALLGLAAAILLSGPFAAAALTKLNAAELTKLNIGITNTATDVGFFIADKKGYFRDAGIEVSTMSFPSAAKMIAPLGTGQLDVGGGTVAAGLYNAVERGVQVRVVADKGSVTDKYEYSTLLVRKDLVDSGRYKSLRDLKGMTVAVAAQGAGSESSLNEALKKGGLKFSDANAIYLGFPEMLVALRNKGIDAGVTNEPTVTSAIREGVAERASPDPIYPGQQTAVVLYSEGFATKNKELAQKFMNAYIRAIRDYNGALIGGKLAGPQAEEILSILTEYTAIKDRAVYADMTAFAVNPDGRVNTETLKNDLMFYRERGLVGTKVGVEQVVDNSFADEAARVLGPYKGAQR
ncbi:MAG: transporter substrate-binding protein [Rhodospirillales bacterium]|jgi:NitT/TauT family transport system substrate-binding protein|nr:transporter substrate-binding protein [Rhodospirillales bacterium]